MYVLKKQPEDFIVRERITLEHSENGKYSYYLLTKKNYNTVDAIRHIAQKLNIQERFINFAGTKDHTAITEQYISIANGPCKDYEWKDLTLKCVGRGKERLNLGSLEGNSFEIVIRNLNPKCMLPQSLPPVPNYFGPQRFGKKRDNVVVGELLLKGDFKGAVARIIENGTRFGLENSHDPIRELRKIPKRLLLMYIHSLQSDIWNKAVSTYLGGDNTLVFPTKVSENSRDLRPALIGFGTEPHTGEVQKINEHSLALLKQRGLTQHSFIIRSFPEITSEGDARNMWCEVSEYTCSELRDDELHEGKKCCTVSFFLPKGCYATVVIASLAHAAGIESSVL